MARLKLRKKQDEEMTWITSYSDMITNLLCVFLLLLAGSTLDNQRFRTMAESVESALGADKARERPGEVKTQQQPPLPVIAQAPPAAPARPQLPQVTPEVREPIRREPPLVTPPPPAPQPQAQPQARPQGQVLPEGTDLKSVTDAARRIKSIQEIQTELESKFGKDSTAVELDRRESGVAVNLKSGVFFDSASAELKRDAVPLLASIAATLAGTPYRITVEGHTDNLPIRTWLFPSNWELSAGRASRVARFLIEHGVPETHMAVLGLADTRPLVPNTAPGGQSLPENQARNRRVVIVVSPTS